LIQYHREIKNRDTYVVYAVLPNRKTSDADQANKRPGLRVIREDDDGVVLSGVKALATAALFADEIWIGNLQPIARDHGTDAITCAIRRNAEGLQLWSRKAFAGNADSEFDSPLTSRFDEGDAVLIFDQVKVDWKYVFAYSDSVRSSEIYFQTPARPGRHWKRCICSGWLGTSSAPSSQEDSSSMSDSTPAHRL
jgi:4-hydroxyphenylacetate 3-monooxygenase